MRFFEIVVLGAVTGISAAGLTGVATVPTIGVALAYFQLPVPPVLVLLLAIDPILTLPRAATTGVLAMAISVISSGRSTSTESSSKSGSSFSLLSQDGEAPSLEGG